MRAKEVGAVAGAPEESVTAVVTESVPPFPSLVASVIASEAPVAGAV